MTGNGRRKIKAAALLLRARLAVSRAGKLLDLSSWEASWAERLVAQGTMAGLVQSTRRAERLTRLARRSHVLGAALASRAATEVLSIGMPDEATDEPRARGVLAGIVGRLASLIGALRRWGGKAGP